MALGERGQHECVRLVIDRRQRRLVDDAAEVRVHPGRTRLRAQLRLVGARAYEHEPRRPSQPRDRLDERRQVLLLGEATHVDDPRRTAVAHAGGRRRERRRVDAIGNQLDPRGEATRARGELRRGRDDGGRAAQADALERGLDPALRSGTRQPRIPEAVGDDVRHAEARTSDGRRDGARQLEHPQDRTGRELGGVRRRERERADRARCRARRREYPDTLEQDRVARELLEPLGRVREVVDATERGDVRPQVAVDEPRRLPAGRERAQTAAGRGEHADDHRRGL